MKRGEKFEQLMEIKGTNANKLSKDSGVAYTTVKSMIERDFKNASIDNVVKIANALGVPISEFIPEAEPTITNTITIPLSNQHIYEKENLYNIYKHESDKRSLNVVNYFGEISAGELTSVEPFTNCEQIDLPKEMLGKFADREGIFVMKVNGESMNKLIPNGSYVVCVPIEDYELKNDDIVIYSLNNESSMKRYWKDADNNAIIFSPESTDRGFHDVVLSLDTISEVNIHAKVILYAVTLN